MSIFGKLIDGLTGKGTGAPRCVACDGNELTLLAPSAYRCKECGYEGGDGYAEYQQGQRLRAFDQLSAEERTQGARADLLEARSLLVAARGSYESAKKGTALRVAVDVAGLLDGGSSSESSSEHDNELLRADGLVLEAGALFRDAWYKISGHPAGALTVPQLPQGFWDSALHELSPAASHRSDVEQGLVRLEATRRAVEHVLESVFDEPSSP